MISTNSTIISINVRKKLMNDKFLHSNINSINTNSHNTIIKYINTKPVVNQQQHVHQQIYQNQPLFIPIAKQINKEIYTSLPSHTVWSHYPEQKEFTTTVKYFSDNTVSTLINISPSSLFIFYFSDDGLSTETGYKTFPNPMSLHLKPCLIAPTHNNISQGNKFLS